MHYLCNMEWEIVHIDETDSTNRWLRKHVEERTEEVCEPCVAVTEYQTAGRGCGTNTWESERGKNLTFSIAFCPQGVKASQQFLISQQISVALADTLSQYAEGFSIKWPNDIYWHDKKICGILIENVLKGDSIRYCIAGIGLNVNQREFLSDAPNPVSLCQVVGHEMDREALLADFLHHLEEAFQRDSIRQEYGSLLFRQGMTAAYADKEGPFQAVLEGVEDDGHLVLRDDSGRQRRYAFKEVAFVGQLDNYRDRQ